MWKKKQFPSQLSNFPPGTYIKTERGYFFVLPENRRFYFITKRVLDSWSPQRVLETTEERAKYLTIGAKMKFRDGSLLHCQADGKMYLVSNKKLRHITSPDILTGLGAQRKDAVWVSLDEINLHEIGDPLS